MPKTTYGLTPSAEDEDIAKEKPPSSSSPPTTSEIGDIPPQDSNAQHSSPAIPSSILIDLKSWFAEQPALFRSEYPVV